MHQSAYGKNWRVLAWVPINIQGFYIRMMLKGGTWDGPQWLLDQHGLGSEPEKAPDRPSKWRWSVNGGWENSGD
jgi:hypothetical protein